MRVCNWPGCDRLLDKRNKCGLCKEHYRKDPAYRRKMSKSVTAGWKPRKLSEEERRERKRRSDHAHRQKNLERIKAREKQYRETHREQIKERNRRYYRNNKQAIAKKQADYYQRNKEAKAEYYRGYREKNKEALAEYHREWHENNRAYMISYYRERYKANKEEYAKRSREYALNHKDEIAERNRRYRACKAGASKEHFTEAEFQSLCEKYGWICLRCGAPHSESTLHGDHVIPLSRGGSDAISNIQPLCGSCNNQKRVKIIDWRCEL